MNMKRAILFFGLIAFNIQFSVFNAVEAQNIIRPKIYCPNGITINSYSGVLTYQRTDVSIPCRSMPLAAAFYYNSSANEENYSYGNGWSLGYEFRYKISNNDSLITIRYGNGRGDDYWYKNGVYVPPVGVFSTLTYENGVVTLTTREGTVYTFEDQVTRKLTQFRDRNNNSINLQYTNGKMTRLTDPAGRAIDFVYNADGNLESITDPAGRMWRYTYDENGNLTSVTNPANHTVHYGYNKENRLCTFTDPDGHSTWVTYNKDGQAHRVQTELTDKSIRYEKRLHQTVIVDYMGEDPENPGQQLPNQFTTYKWDEQGRVIEKTGNCCGSVAKYEYDRHNNVTRSEDANGNVTTYSYDANGNMLSMTDPLGYTDYYTYDPIVNRVSTHIDRVRGQYSFTYDANGNITKATSPKNTFTSFDHNQYGQVTSVTDSMGNVVSYTYDEYGNPKTYSNVLGNTINYSYDILGRIRSKTDSYGNVTQYDYDVENNLTSVTDPYGNISSFTYSPSGVITSVSSPRGTLGYRQDALGNLVQFTDLLGNTSSFTRNAKGKVTRIDAPGNTIQFRYDERNRIVSSTNTLGKTENYTYDGLDQLTSVVHPNGRNVEYTYDERGQLVKVSDQNGLIYSISYDTLGRKKQILQFMSEENGRNIYDTISFVYDGLGHVTKYKIGSLQFTLSYDSLGYCRSIIDADGNSNTYVYDAPGHMLSSSTDYRGNTTNYTYNTYGQCIFQTDDNGNSVGFYYDNAGRLSTITDALGHSTQYQYNNKGQLSQVTYPNDKTEQYNYDSRGNVSQFKDKSGQQFNYTYDDANRLVSKVYPDGSSKQYTYDIMNHLISVSDANGSIQRDYDALGRVLSETTSSHLLGAETSVTTTYSYDDVNQIITITYPSGRIVEQHYDIRNRLISVATADNISLPAQSIVDFMINNRNRIESFSYGNDVTTQYKNDIEKRLTSINVYGSNPATWVSGLNYSYDAFGNISSQIDSVNLPFSEFYQYDDYSRLSQFAVGTPNNTLIQTDIPSSIQQFTYDPLGNRISTQTTTQTSNSTISYASNAVNGYTTVGNQAMQYDGNGNLVSDGVHTYQYDYANRLVSVDNGTITYSYDPLGRRIRKVVDGVITDYRYAGGQMIESTTGGVTTSYVYSPRVDDVLMAIQGEQHYYYHKDHLGSTKVVTDGNGDVVERYSYEAFGKPHFYNANGVELASSAINNDLLFTGREYDRETGLYHYRSRALDPITGRFLQQDPIKYGDGLNMYSYTYNNPVMYIDPMGLDGGKCDGDCNPVPEISKRCIYHPEYCDIPDYGEGATRAGVTLGGCIVGGKGLCLEIKIGKERVGRSPSWQSFIKITPSIAAGKDVTGHFGGFFEHDFGKKASNDIISASIYEEFAIHRGVYGGSVSLAGNGEQYTLGANGALVIYGASGGINYNEKSDNKWSGMVGSDLGIGKDALGHGWHLSAGLSTEINLDRLEAHSFADDAIQFLEYMDGYWEDVVVPGWQEIDDERLQIRREIHGFIEDIKNLPDKAAYKASETANNWLNNLCNF